MDDIEVYCMGCYFKEAVSESKESATVSIIDTIISGPYGSLRPLGLACFAQIVLCGNLLRPTCISQWELITY